MIVVRRAAAAAGVAVLVLLGSPAWAQEDPCAPGPDGSVPEMCQGGAAPEPAPEEDPCAPGPDGSVPEMCQDGAAPEPAPGDPCPAQPVEPGDGVVTDEGGGSSPGEPGTAEPAPAAEEPPAEEPAAEEPPAEEPAPDQPVSNEPGANEEEQVYCAFGVPVSAPVDSAAGGAESAAGGGQPLTALPRTGVQERLLVVAALGAGMLVLGAGAAALGRRRDRQA